jgi:hypothetical protein
MVLVLFWLALMDDVVVSVGRKKVELDMVMIPLSLSVI